MKLSKSVVRARLAAIALGCLWLGGCVSDLALRDFLSTTAVRTFWQTVGAALQAAVVDASA